MILFCRWLVKLLQRFYIQLDILSIELFGKRISANSVVFRAFSFVFRVAVPSRAREGQHSSS